MCAADEGERYFLFNVRRYLLARTPGENGSLNARRVVVLLGFAAAFTLLGVCAERYANFIQGRETSFFSSALREAYVTEDVSVHGVSFEVADGAVHKNGIEISGPAALPALRLAYEKALARRSPLISLAGVDPADLVASVKTLEEARGLLASLKENTSDADIIRSSLYPVDFLNDAAKLETARQTFLQSGSDADAGNYEDVLRLTIDDYEKDIVTYRAAFVAIVPYDMRSYSTAGLFIDRNETLGAIGDMATGMEETRSLFEKRLACLNGALGLCDPGDIAFPELPEEEASGALPASALDTTADVRIVLAQVLQSPALSTEPLIELKNSSCIAATTLPPLFVLYPATSWVDGSPREAAMYVGDIRFNETSTFPTVPFEQFFASRDSEYVPNDFMSHYDCPYLGSDFGRLFAVQAVSDAARTSPLSVYATGKTKETLTQLEKVLMPTNSVLKESDALAYVRTAEMLAESPGAPPALSDQAAALALLFKDPSAGFAHVVAKIAEIEERNALSAMQHGLPVDLSAQTLFYYRSAFIALFMGDNASAVGKPDSFFAAYSIPENEQPYIYFSSLSNNPVIRQKLIDDMRTYYGLHRFFGTTTPSSGL